MIGVKGNSGPSSNAPATGSNGLLRSKALFQAALGAIRFRKAISEGPLLLAAEQVPLVMGGLISLFSVEADGYMLSEGFVNTNCSISHYDISRPGSSKVPPNFEDCVFRVVPKHKYDARNELNEALTRFNRDRSSISTLLTGGGDGMIIYFFIFYFLFFLFFIYFSYYYFLFLLLFYFFLC